jgi:uncharacterized protein YkwD
MCHRFAPLAGAILLLAGCVAQNQLKTTAVSLRPDPATQMPALERRIYELVDLERRKLAPSAKPLALDSELVGVAREKSADMAAHRYLAHSSPSGQTAATLIMDKDASFQGLLGENIAAQPFPNGAGIDVDVYARRIVDTWLTSAQHRDNLAYPPYDRTGIGAAVSDNTIYITELFASDLSLSSPATLPKRR